MHIRIYLAIEHGGHIGYTLQYLSYTWWNPQQQVYIIKHPGGSVTQTQAIRLVLSSDHC